MKSWVNRIAAVLVGGGLTLAVLKAGWVAYTLRMPVPGTQLVAGSVLSDPPRFALQSFGVMAAVFCVAAVLLFWLARPKLLALTGTALVFTGLAAFYQVALYDPALLWNLINDHQQYREAESFAKRSLPVNLGTEPTRSRQMSADNLGNRMVTAQYFMGPGWYAALGAGLTAFGCGLLGMGSAGERWRMSLFGTGAAAILTAICLDQPMRAQRALARGIELETAGKLYAGVEKYRRSLELDRWYQFDPRVRQRIGAIDASLGRTDTIEHGMYQVELCIQQEDLRSAIGILDQLVHREGEHQLPLRRRRAALWTHYGRDLYRTSAVGDAALSWKAALRDNPNQMMAAFGLSRAYYDQAQYADSLNVIESLLTKTSDPMLRSNLYSNQGDAFTKIGDFAQAHIAYRKSYKEDAVLNWRALTALVGGD